MHTPPHTPPAMPTSRHPFARAGYAGPYTFIGGHVRVHRAGDHIQPGGCCDVCGTGYKYGATFRDACGRDFHTGLDCAEKSLRDYDSAMAQKCADTKREIMSQIRANQREQNREAREAARTTERELVERENARVYTDEIEPRLAQLENIAHPSPYRADKGESWADSVRYYLSSGHIRGALTTLEQGLRAVADGTAQPRTILPMVRAGAQHVAKVGDRVEIRGSVLAKIRYETMYGYKYIVKIVTSEGDLLGCRTTSPWSFAPLDSDGCETSLHVGAEVHVKVTVKEHGSDTYHNNAPITWVQRPSRVKPKAPRKPRAKRQ